MQCANPELDQTEIKPSNFPGEIFVPLSYLMQQGLIRPYMKFPEMDVENNRFENGD
eukprot:TRINITY_DN8483_c0_g1_i1.p5 TRINITY_DN8483_c0_g1~~TRINITY_DN8483_c0_g1_i1.p5  ORF type:complete len:56 (-),score=11.93 TRINITY_DN8483_c0_g1_i1:115-282(-)